MNLRRITSLLFAFAFCPFLSCTVATLDGEGTSASVGGVSSNGNGTMTVTLNGSGFVTGVTVTINSRNCAGVQIVSSTQLTCILAEGVELVGIVIHYPTEGGSGGSGGGSGGGGSSLTVHTLFVTSTPYDGNLGGLSGADTKCVNHAVVGSKTSALAGTWRAILSTTAVNAKDRISLVSGVEVKNTFNFAIPAVTTTANIWSGSISNAVIYDENGTPAATDRVWTGSGALGNSAGGGLDCNTWTSNAMAHNGQTGNRTSTSVAWINESFMTCLSDNHLYCINSTN